MLIRDNFLAAPDRRCNPITETDELRIRRAIRFAVESSRHDTGSIALGEYVFDLVGFLRPEVQAIVDDEVACTFANLIGST